MQGRQLAPCALLALSFCQRASLFAHLAILAVSFNSPQKAARHSCLKLHFQSSVEVSLDHFIGGNTVLIWHWILSVPRESFCVLLLVIPIQVWRGTGATLQKASASCWWIYYSPGSFVSKLTLALFPHDTNRSGQEVSCNIFRTNPTDIWNRQLDTTSILRRFCWV